MFSRRRIQRCQKKIPRYRFLIQEKNLLRPDIWHAEIIVTDSQSWMRTRTGKKVVRGRGGLEEEMFPQYLVSTTLPICQESQDLEVFCFLCYGFRAA